MRKNIRDLDGAISEFTKGYQQCSYCNIIKTGMECKAPVQCAILKMDALFLPTELHSTALLCISRKLCFGPDSFVFPVAA
jgi:hypothetical protein